MRRADAGRLSVVRCIDPPWRKVLHKVRSSAGGGSIGRNTGAAVIIVYVIG
jgi:hypothetical protein